MDAPADDQTPKRWGAPLPQPPPSPAWEKAVAAWQQSRPHWDAQRDAARDAEWLRKIPQGWRRITIWRVHRVLERLEAMGGYCQVPKDEVAGALDVPQYTWERTQLRERMLELGLIRIQKRYGKGVRPGGGTALPREPNIIVLVVPSATWRAEYWEIIWNHRFREYRARNNARKVIRARLYGEAWQEQERRNDPEFAKMLRERDQKVIEANRGLVDHIEVDPDEVDAWAW